MSGVQGHYHSRRGIMEWSFQGIIKLQIATIKGMDKVYVGNENQGNISHIGQRKIGFCHNSLTLKNVSVVPEIRKNLL